MKTVLLFENPPRRLRRKVLAGVLDFSGIQTFIFGGLDRYTPSREVAQRSEYIAGLSRLLAERLRARFGGQLLFETVSSGKIYFALSSAVAEREAEAVLEAETGKVFASTDGRLAAYYALTPAVLLQEMQFDGAAMRPAPEVLAEQLAEKKLRPLSLLTLDLQAHFDGAMAYRSVPRQEAAWSGRKMAVKLDLDNLGAFFREIRALDTRDRVSRALDGAITCALDADPTLIPIFKGGDDIFFLCDFEGWMGAVSGFYRRLKARVQQSPELWAYGPLFSVSGGVRRIARMETPLIFYSENAEKYLMEAKNRGKNRLIANGRELNWAQLEALATLVERDYDRIFPVGSADEFLEDAVLLAERIRKVGLPASEEMRICETVRI